MDWSSLLIGAVVGGAMGVMMQNILYPKLERQWRTRRRAHAYRQSNHAWAQIERLHPRLVLVQAGWDQHGCFAEGTITLRLGQPFALDDPEVRRLRDTHSPEWVERGFTDGEQIGIAAIAVSRTSDNPEVELEGRVSPATVMGPPLCHELGTTSGRGRGPSADGGPASGTRQSRVSL